jgi:hypothetical protein
LGTGHRSQSVKLEEEEEKLNLAVDILTNPQLSYEILLQFPKLYQFMKTLGFLDAKEKVGPRVL